MSSDLDVASDELHGIHRDLLAAIGLIEELRDAARSVRRLLDDATADAAKTHVVDEPMASGYMRNVAQQMEQLAGRCALTEAIGTDLGAYLEHATHRVDRVKEALDTVDLAAASTDDMKLASRTRARLDGVSDLLEMAQPAAAAAAGHLTAVKHIASQRMNADTTLGSRVSVDQGLSVATDVLARTETRLQQLGDLLDHSDRGTRRSLHEADEVTQHAHRRLTAHRPNPAGEPAPAMHGPRR
ncbi:hypothetical protein [Flexivirga oryzae]|uniref:Uncharacterized protein n=1 Tax=Flexivirga oryzae TaxID=1794944 RepID=A0A839N2Y0_9MICO|nr:hypothetical protein [Flexivirga oryzae]MBB2892090.1 hypothetical protein [Flexivirga oryzae]